MTSLAAASLRPAVAARWHRFAVGGASLYDCAGKAAALAAAG